MHRLAFPSSKPFHPLPRGEEILEQLESILLSSFFTHSERCRKFLGYVVGQAIAGKSNELDERQIAIEVFGREPTYDPNDDSIVRTTAVDVRKRLAQFYYDVGREKGILIEIQPGSYKPHFKFPNCVPIPTHSSAVDMDAVSSQGNDMLEGVSAVHATAKPKRRLSRSLILAVTVFVGAAVIIVAALRGIRAFPFSDPIDAFWDPILDRTDSVILATGSSSEPVWPQARSSSEKRSTIRESYSTDIVVFDDAVVLTRVAGLVSAKKKRFEVLRAGSLNASNIRWNPTILVSLNNPWSWHVMQKLRFRFELEPDSGTMILRDQENPAQVVWRSLSANDPIPSSQSDRAIISRVMDSETAQMVLIIAGVGKGGTLAAAEFVTEPKHLAALASRAPSGWKHKNLQVVIGTDVVNDSSGSPYIVATYFW
jgi:hypothetical protein